MSSGAACSFRTDDLMEVDHIMPQSSRWKGMRIRTGSSSIDIATTEKTAVDAVTVSMTTDQTHRGAG